MVLRGEFAPEGCGRRRGGAAEVCERLLMPPSPRSTHPPTHPTPAFPPRRPPRPTKARGGSRPSRFFRKGVEGVLEKNRENREGLALRGSPRGGSRPPRFFSVCRGRRVGGGRPLRPCRGAGRKTAAGDGIPAAHPAGSPAAGSVATVNARTQEAVQALDFYSMYFSMYF